MRTINIEIGHMMAQPYIHTYSRESVFVCWNERRSLCREQTGTLNIQNRTWMNLIEIRDLSQTCALSLDLFREMCTYTMLQATCIFADIIGIYTCTCLCVFIYSNMGKIVFIGHFFLLFFGGFVCYFAVCDRGEVFRFIAIRVDRIIQAFCECLYVHVWCMLRIFEVNLGRHVQVYFEDSITCLTHVPKHTRSNTILCLQSDDNDVLNAMYEHKIGLAICSIHTTHFTHSTKNIYQRTRDTWLFIKCSQFLIML